MRYAAWLLIAFAFRSPLEKCARQVSIRACLCRARDVMPEVSPWCVEEVSPWCVDRKVCSHRWGMLPPKIVEVTLMRPFHGNL